MAKTVINRYIREIKKYLTGRLTKRWAICAELKNILRDTYDDDEYLTIEMLYEEFGTPKEVAESFYARADVNKLKRRTGIYTVIAVSICVVAVIAIALSVAVIVHSTNNNTTTVSNITQIY